MNIMEENINIVEVDGSFLEGGGQILRIATALSALMKKKIHVIKIRAGRPKPGLMPQHLKGLEIVKALCRGELEGATPESTEVTLFPGKIRGGEYTADTHTAGSITLLIQIALPCALFASSSTIMKFRGGTNTEMAPQFDYLTEVFRPVLENFGVTFDYKLLKRGYFPRGGGEVHLRVNPLNHIKPVILMERGTIEKIYGWAFVAGKLPLAVAQSIAEAATNFLRKNLQREEEKEDKERKVIDIHIEAYKEKDGAAVGSGSGINIIAKSSTGVLLGASAMGKKDMRPEVIGYRAASELKEEIECGACVDTHSQDQIIIFMALAYGGSEVMVGPITEHTKTAIHVCEKLTIARFNIINKGLKSNIIQCVGHGLKNS